MVDKGDASKKIEIQNLVSTIFLGTTFSTIFLFVIIFYMYFEPNSGYRPALKEAFSITASFFGGITTLVAAYVATRLFHDWKAQHNKSVESLSYQEALTLFKQVSLKVRELKDLHTDCVTLIETDDLVDVIDFTIRYKKIRTELNKNLDSFQSSLVFLQTISEESEEIENLEQIYISYISEAKKLLQKPEILEQNFSVSNQDSILEKHLYSESKEQSLLLMKNLKMIVVSFQNKIQAK